MKLWDVEITEVVVRRIKVEADTQQEAEDYGRKGVGVPVYSTMREKVLATGVVARLLSDDN